MTRPAGGGLGPGLRPSAGQRLVPGEGRGEGVPGGPLLPA